MYEDLFDEKSQEKMRAFFLEASEQGIHRSYRKNEVINISSSDFTVIVVKGKIKQVINSGKGVEKSLFILQPGEIFGEMDYFTHSKCDLLVKAMEDSVVSIVYRDKLEKMLEDNPEGYRFFIHSITRKFRIIMFQMADMIFNTSIGKIADTLLRLASQQGKEMYGNMIINISLTHQEIADLIGCSRITVTKGLNELKEKNIVDVQNKKIIIKDMIKLRDYI